MSAAGPDAFGTFREARYLPAVAARAAQPHRMILYHRVAQ
jgi:hypothetical protein